MVSIGENSLPSMPVDAYAALRGPIHMVSRGLAYYVATKCVRAQNKRPLVSITFDDVPDTALVNGARVLERHGVRGTFYIAGGYVAPLSRTGV